MFLKIAKVFGMFPFIADGAFNWLLYCWFFLQVLAAVWFQLIPGLMQKVYEWTNNSFDKVTICVHVAGMLSYFMPFLMHLFMIWKRNFELQAIAKFFDHKKTASNYLSLIGVSIFTISLYFIVQMSALGLVLVETPQHFVTLLNDFHMHYVYWMDFMVTMQHCTLTHKVAEEFRRVSGRAASRVFKATDEGQELFGVSKLISRAYGPQMVVRVMQTMFTGMTFVYGTITNSIPRVKKTWLHTCSEAMILTIILVELLCLCGTACDACCSAEAFNTELFKIMRDSKDLCSNNKLRLYVTMKQTVNFTACGFFSLGYPLVTSIIAAATTYLVILIQFSMLSNS